jgi:DNA polymerase I
MQTFKGLELVTAAYLSRDPVMSQEILDQANGGPDLHATNMRVFKIKERRDAKIFVFKLLYGGTAWGFARQPDFAHISTSVKFWEKLIDEFYKKYQGVAKWHDQLVKEVINTGKLVMPTGREFHYPTRDVIDRVWFWRPKILNYPVQGTGADLVCIGRVTAWKRLRQKSYPVYWQSTVHDSIDVDVPVELVYNVCDVIDRAFKDVPQNFERLFGHKFHLPISAEIEFGKNLEETTKYESNYRP